MLVVATPIGGTIVWKRRVPLQTGVSAAMFALTIVKVHLQRPEIQAVNFEQVDNFKCNQHFGKKTLLKSHAPPEMKRRCTISAR